MPEHESQVSKAGRLVAVEINGALYQVPEGITMIQALWETGHELFRGIGCLGGVCGACASTYRMKGDSKLHYALACQTLVQDGMSFSLNLYYPPHKANYKIQSVKDPKEEIFKYYPEVALCRNCNACTEACPQQINVREGVWKMVFGDFKGVADMFLNCVMCGLCVPVCIADIAPNQVALYARRSQGAVFTPRPDHLMERVREIESGKYDSEWEKLLAMSEEELRAHAAAYQ